MHLAYLITALVFLIIGFLLGWFLAPPESGPAYPYAQDENPPARFPLTAPAVAPPALVAWTFDYVNKSGNQREGKVWVELGCHPADKIKAEYGEVMAVEVVTNLRKVPTRLPVPIKFIVNARLAHCECEEISYEQVVELAGHNSADRVWSVTYHVRKQPGSDSERSGIMHPGCKKVRVESGMIFNVADTSGA